MSGQPTWAEVEEAAWLSDDSQHTREGSSGPSSLIPAWQRNDQDVTDFGPVTLSLDRDIVVVDCPDCGKPVIERFLSFHQQNCALVQDIVNGRISASVLEGKRRKRARSIDSPGPGDASVTGASTFDGDGDYGPPKKKSRKEEKLAEAAARRKARLQEKEAKALKKKNRMSKGDPLNVDRQCGVVTEKGPCSRSLTCKSHSMGAKRAVPGRSKPYDELLFEWQKATNPAFLAKLQEKERIMAAAAREREQTRARKLEAKKKKVIVPKKKAGSKLGDGKKKGSKDGAGGSLKDGTLLGDRGEGLDGARSGGLGSGPDPDADMYTQGASEVDVEVEFESVLEAIRTAAMAPKTMAIPLAVSGRNFGSGAFAHKAMRYRALRAGPPIF
ncbi:SAGA complex subunit Sgf73 [Tilletia horrida]|uniref:SAGA complex subunit Sgf73 n=1 Tax=Tilletia horrida TaxID=155126 RepID=A0AAN6GW62_9BASI|nr:SAGA complex subunit Sgf73 [Tilletia horrida]KAK0557698.1 SAGA complex subunit Sgf73 [Tilletia horrida]KAK0570328.1 SAGA complex subunit Sgf73 [Tilletia horrida]